jgi:hypothetical protein
MAGDSCWRISCGGRDPGQCGPLARAGKTVPASSWATLTTPTTPCWRGFLLGSSPALLALAAGCGRARVAGRPGCRGGRRAASALSMNVRRVMAGVGVAPPQVVLQPPGTVGSPLPTPPPTSAPRPGTLVNLASEIGCSLPELAVAGLLTDRCPAAPARFSRGRGQMVAGRQRCPGGRRSTLPPGRQRC